MLKVKLFSYGYADSLEEGLNAFLSEFKNPANVIDIKYSTSMNGEDNIQGGKVETLYSALVYYKDYSKDYSGNA